MAAKRTKSTPERGALHFKVDSGLLFELGERLVAKQSVALAELVKNAYDADATQVVVRLEDVTEEGGKIIVEDNGVGMTFDDVERAWMTIGTQEKIKHPISSIYKRPRTGDKGVGRFAARRLAKRLRLRTVSEPEGAKGYKELIEVDFDWDKFKSGSEVNQVANSFRRKRVGEEESCGTIIELIDVRDIWSKNDVKELQRNLTGLYSPFPADPIKGTTSDPGFSIIIETKEFQEYSGKLEKRFLEASYAELEGSLSANGQPKFMLKFRGEEKPYVFEPKERTFSQLGPLNFQISYFPYQRDYYEGLDFSLSDARKMGREHGGVNIFFHKFRVPPYGDPGDDWLNLDEERARRLTKLPEILQEFGKGLERPMLLIPGNNQLFGGVFLSRKRNPDFHLTLNRERLMENYAFEELVKFVRLGVDWMTVLHARKVAEKVRAREEAQPMAKPVQLVGSAIERLEKATTPIGKEERTQVVQLLKLARETAAKKEEEHISELSMLRVLASTGTMIVVFDHQLMGILNGLRQSHENLRSFLEKVEPDERSTFGQVVDRLKGWISDAEHQGQLLGLLMGTDSRSRRQRWAIRPEVETMKGAFKNYMDEMGIEFINDVAADVRTPPMFECELMAILMNLMTNALKAVGEQANKRIRVSVRRTKDEVKVLFSDTGVGITRGKRDEYFKPFVSETEPHPILGHGTGLGLKIVKDLADVYGGQAQFIDVKKPWSTCVEIALPEK